MRRHPNPEVGWVSLEVGLKEESTSTDVAPLQMINFYIHQLFFTFTTIRHIRYYPLTHFVNDQESERSLKNKIKSLP